MIEHELHRVAAGKTVLGWQVLVKRPRCVRAVQEYVGVLSFLFWAITLYSLTKDRVLASQEHGAIPGLHINSIYHRKFHDRIIYTTSESMCTETLLEHHLHNISSFLV